MSYLSYVDQMRRFYKFDEMRIDGYHLKTEFSVVVGKSTIGSFLQVMDPLITRLVFEEFSKHFIRITKFLYR